MDFLYHTKGDETIAGGWGMGSDLGINRYHLYISGFFFQILT